MFVRDVFGVVPDAWQDDVLAMFPRTPRLAMKACKGPGKTTVLAWLCWNFLMTRPRPKIAAVSISAENLADGLWTEMAKWRAKSPLITSQFTWTKTRIFANCAPEEWWMSARTWPKKADASAQADTLAGLHLRLRHLRRLLALPIGTLRRLFQHLLGRGEFPLEPLGLGSRLPLPRP